MASGFQCIEQVVRKRKSLFKSCCRRGYINQLPLVWTKQFSLLNLVAPFIVLLRPLYEAVYSTF